MQESSCWISAIPNPSIETWFDVDRDAFRRGPTTSRIEKYRQADIRTLRSRDEQFAQFYDAKDHVRAGRILDAGRFGDHHQGRQSKGTGRLGGRHRSLGRDKER